LRFIQIYPIKTNQLTNFIEPDKIVINLFDPEIHVEVVNGRIDLNKITLKVLKCRGLDKNGKWDGFDSKANKNNYLQ